MISFGDLNKPINGYALRCWKLAKTLSDNGSKVSVYQFSNTNNQSIKEGIDINSISSRHENKSTSNVEKILGFNPFSIIYFQLEGAWKLYKIRRIINQVDKIYIEGCLLINAFLITKLLKKPLILDTHCINKEVALKIKKQNKFKGTIRAITWHFIEKNLLRNSDKIIAISDHDKKTIEQLYAISPDKIEVISHVVNEADEEKHSKKSQILRKNNIKGYSKIACFIGDLGAIQNIESVKYIRGILAPETPNIRYVIVGNNPNNFKDKDNIKFTGFVDSVDPYILMSDICIAPMSIGSGIKTKLLDYMKYKKPIIATSVAAEGINTKDNLIKVIPLNAFPIALKEFAL